MYRVIDLPCEVDLSKAKATLNDSTLEIVMPKAAPTKSIRVETKPESRAEDRSAVHETSGIEAAGISPVVNGDNELMAKSRAASSGR